MRRMTSLLVSLAAASALAIAPAHANQIGDQGCTPGYWKNHTESWQEYSSTAKVSSVFDFTSVPAPVAAYSDVTLLRALSLRGGSGLQGATEILLRAATAAILNAAHEGVGYPLRRTSGDWDGDGDKETGIRPLVNAALASGSRTTMLALAKRLDQLNNLGCPL